MLSPVAVAILNASPRAVDGGSPRAVDGGSPRAVDGGSPRAVDDRDLVEWLPDGRVRLHPHAGQSAMLRSQRRFVFAFSGTQAGKTSLGPWWLLREITTHGSGDYLAVTATYDLFKLKMLPALRRVFVTGLGWTFLASDRLLLSPDGHTRLILRSAESEGGLESATVKAAWMDECGQDRFRVDSWEAIQRRLSLYGGRALGTTTPYNLGWCKTEVYDRWLAGDADIEVVQFASTLNPQFPLTEYERARRVLPGWKFQMFYNGIFDRPAGLVYDIFRPELHQVQPFPLPLEWSRYVGLDFGGGVHTALLWVAEDVEHACYYVYRESMSGGQTTREMTHAALDFARHERVVQWVGGAPSEQQDRWDWADFGVPVERPPESSLEIGIDRVTQYFKERRLFIFSNCTGLLDELGSYRRELDAAGQPTATIKDKSNYHRLDALRYVCLALSQTAQTTVGEVEVR